MLFIVGAKSVAVVPGQSSLSVADVTAYNRVSATSIMSQVTSISSANVASQAPTTIRLANPPQNAVLLGPYGPPAAPVPNSGAPGLPVTLQPLMPTVDSRQTADRYV